MRRLTDPNKWDDPWFQKLPPKLKLLWLYMQDSCNANRIWQEDLELAAEETGMRCSRQEYLDAFKGKIQPLEEGVIQLLKAA